MLTNKRKTTLQARMIKEIKEEEAAEGLGEAISWGLIYLKFLTFCGFPNCLAKTSVAFVRKSAGILSLATLV